MVLPWLFLIVFLGVSIWLLIYRMKHFVEMRQYQRHRPSHTTIHRHWPV